MRYKYHEREIFWSGPDPVLIEEKKKKKKGILNTSQENPIF